MTYEIIKADSKHTVFIKQLAIHYASSNHSHKNFTFDPEHTGMYIEASLKSSEDVFFLAKDEEGGYVGGVWGGRRQSYHTPDYIAVEYFTFVHPYFTGKGIGESLIVSLEQWALDNGCVAIQTGARSGIKDNKAALGMYKKLDYEEQGMVFIRKFNV